MAMHSYDQDSIQQAQFVSFARHELTKHLAQQMNDAAAAKEFKRVADCAKAIQRITGASDQVIWEYCKQQGLIPDKQREGIPDQQREGIGMKVLTHVMCMGATALTGWIGYVAWSAFEKGDVAWVILAGVGVVPGWTASQYITALLRGDKIPTSPR